MQELSLENVTAEGSWLAALPSLPALTSVGLSMGVLLDRPAEVLASLVQVWLLPTEELYCTLLLFLCGIESSTPVL